MKIVLKERLKTHKGITLIALVITIIVLLILAGVAIATLTGDNGIIAKAQQAKMQNDKANEKEQIDLAVLASKINNDASIDKKTLRKELDGISNLIESGIPTSDEYSFPLILVGKTGTEYEIDEDANLELFESEAQETFISSKDNIKILFNRFLNECVKRDNQINKILKGMPREELEQSIDNIVNIRKGANELTLLGRLSSLNQGIRTQLYEQVNYLSSLTNSIARTLQFTNEEFRVFDKLKKGQELSESEEAIYSELEKYFTNVELNHLINDQYAYKPFDLNEFVNNKETQEFFKHWYKYKSPFVNILDAILTVPHFGEMLKTFTTNNTVLDSLTVRRANIININRELQSLGVIKGGLTPKITNKINRFLTDCIINDYFKTVAPITIPGVTTEYVEGNPIHLDSAEDYIINFDNLDNRLTFKNWMEEYLINLFRTRNDNFAKNITVKNFQNDLRVPYTMCALDIDMSTMSRDINETRLSDISIDYSKLYS